VGFRIEKTYRVFEHPYHRFFILKKVVTIAKVKNSPTVSVIIPTYKRSHLVDRAIKSVLNLNYIGRVGGKEHRD